VFVCLGSDVKLNGVEYVLLCVSAEKFIFCVRVRSSVTGRNFRNSGSALKRHFSLRDSEARPDYGAQTLFVRWWIKLGLSLN
jgi:hypothetical protein